MANERTFLIDPFGTPSSAPPSQLRLGLGMLARSVIVDNTTGQWYRISGTDRRVPPYTVEMVFRLPNGTQNAEIVPDTPPSFASAPRAGERAVFVFSDADQREEPGISVSPVTIVNPSPVQSSTPDEGGGSIAVGGTAQTVFAANPDRRYLLVQNLSTTNVLWVRHDGSAATESEPSIALNPAPNAGEGGGSLTMEGTFISDALISVVGALAGEDFTAFEG